MKITFWGGARNVTGSRHLVDVDGHRFLLDCGLFQGRRAEAETRNRKLPFDASQVDAVVLSHAHIDHSGNLPMLVKSGFEGLIHSTRATGALLEPMLYDSAHIQERDAEFLNRRESRKNMEPVEPLYTAVDVDHTLQKISGHTYGVGFEVVPGVQVHFRDAGHILGSALSVLDIEENGARRRVCFTGDLGRSHLPIIRDPETVSDVDTLIIESTYGNRRHDEAVNVPQKMAELLNRAHERKGKILIPAFAVGRTQEVVTVLKELFESGKVPRMPVYVDSPLAVNVTEVFRNHPECFDEETLSLLHDDHTDPFGFKLIHYIQETDESKALNEKEGPMIIISASGMCEAGRIRHHLFNNIENAKTMIIIVGFQAEHTLGRKLVEQMEEVKIFGEPMRRRAEVHVIDAFSAHADRDELLEWVGALKHAPRKIFVVHGEEEQSLSFAEALKQRGFRKTIVPQMGETHEL